MKFKVALFAVALAIGIGIGGITSANAEMTKDDIELIVKEYLLNNPEVILKSVNDYQTKGASEQQAQAIQANARKLYDDSNTPVAGNENGDVRVVEFFDYNCGYCKRVVGDVNKLIREDDGVKVIFKDYPILGPTSVMAAHWALASDKQGKYLEYHTALLEHQGRISDDVLESVAKDVGLDVEKLKADAQSEEIKSQINENLELAQSMGITGTPAFIFEGEVFPGAIPYAAMQQAVKDARAKGDSE